MGLALRAKLPSSRYIKLDGNCCCTCEGNNQSKCQLHGRHKKTSCPALWIRDLFGAFDVRVLLGWLRDRLFCPLVAIDQMIAVYNMMRSMAFYFNGF